MLAGKIDMYLLGDMNRLQVQLSCDLGFLNI